MVVTEIHAMIKAEVIFREIPMQMLLVTMLAAFEDRKEPSMRFITPQSSSRSE
jgi:hypothetical protein